MIEFIQQRFGQAQIKLFVRRQAIFAHELRENRRHTGAIHLAVQLLRKILVGRRRKDLASATQVTESYISQLLARKKTPPAPGRTDLYDKIDEFLAFLKDKRLNVSVLSETAWEPSLGANHAVKLSWPAEKRK